MSIKGFDDLIANAAFQSPDALAIIPPNICTTFTTARGILLYKPGEMVEDLLDSYQSVQCYRFTNGGPLDWNQIGLYARYSEVDDLAEGIRLNWGGMGQEVNIYHETRNMVTGALGAIIDQVSYGLPPPPLWTPLNDWTKLEFFFDPINGIGVNIPMFPSILTQFWPYANAVLLRPGRCGISWQESVGGPGSSMLLDEWIVDEG